MKAICSVLTLIVLGLYLIDPLHERVDKGWIIVLYLLVGSLVQNGAKMKIAPYSTDYECR